MVCRKQTHRREGGRTEEAFSENYRGSSLTRRSLPQGPHSNFVPRALRKTWGVGVFLCARCPYRREGGAKCEVVPRGARIQGSKTFVSLNARIESNKQEKERGTHWRTAALLLAQESAVYGGFSDARPPMSTRSSPSTVTASRCCAAAKGSVVPRRARF